MRISDDRYSRDRLRFDIAVQFIRHEARTHTIRAWTGLSDDRIRKLYRSYLCEPQCAPLTRHRGKSPQQVAFFMRTVRARQEAALLASLYRLLGALPLTAAPELARSLPVFDAGTTGPERIAACKALFAQPPVTRVDYTMTSAASKASKKVTKAKAGAAK